VVRHRAELHGRPIDDRRVQLQRLLASAWWDWDRATLKARFAELADLETFLAQEGV
jgi:hypothetical protein